MKNKWIGIFCIFIFCTSNLKGIQVSFKAAYSFYWGEQKEEGWFSTTNYFLKDIIPQGKIQAGGDLSLDIVFQFHKNLSLSMGGEYISRPFDGSQGEFTFPNSSEMQGTALYTPVMDTIIYGFPVSLTFTYHLIAAVYFKLFGGGAYYFGKLICNGSRVEFPDQRRTNLNWPYIGLHYETKIKSTGYHVGTGFDVGVSDKAFLFLDMLYRFLEFEDFDTYSVLQVTPMNPNPSEPMEKFGLGTTFLYLYRMGGEEAMGEMDYRISKLDMSGLAVRIGLRFGF
jgi:hypothetical protein